MAPTRRAVLGMAAATIGLAGCTGSGGEQNPPAPTATPGEMPAASPSPTMTDSGMSSALVRVQSHPELGEILVGPDGLTLYMFDQDERGTGASTCSGGCAQTWPPLTVDGSPTAGEAVTTELTTFEREDGSTQIAAGGWPLYYFTPDEAPGETRGQGVGGVWWVLRPDGTPVRPEPTETPTPDPATVRVRSHPELGEILVGPEGMTLYMFDQDEQGAGTSSCTGGCASAWPPLTVEGTPTKDAAVGADVSTLQRQGDATQVAAGGWPLYYWSSDSAPGDATGQGVNDVWWVLRPDGTPVRSMATATPTSTPSDDYDY